MLGLKLNHVSKRGHRPSAAKTSAATLLIMFVIYHGEIRYIVQYCLQDSYSYLFIFIFICNISLLHTCTTLPYDGLVPIGTFKISHNSVISRVYVSTSTNQVSSWFCNIDTSVVWCLMIFRTTSKLPEDYHPYSLQLGMTCSYHLRFSTTNRHLFYYRNWRPFITGK